MKVLKNKITRVMDEPSYVKIKPIFNDFHKLIMDGSYEYPMHCHSTYEVIIVENGPYFCTLNNAELTIEDNQFLIVKPGDWHQDHLYDKQSHYVLHFSILIDSPIESNLLTNSIIANNQIFYLGDEWNPTIFFDEMERNIKADDNYTFKLQEPLMEAFFWNMIRSIPEKFLSESFLNISRQEIFQENIMKLFSSSYRTFLTVDQISSELRMSKRALSIYCKKYFNESPAKLFLKYKLNKSIDIIKTENLSIKDISSYLGFDNQFHFSRVFKRVYGLCPTQFNDMEHR